MRLSVGALVILTVALNACRESQPGSPPPAPTTPTASTTPTEGPTPTITGTPPPPAKGNDDFAGAVVIAEPLPYGNKQDTTGATLQLGEPRPCAGIGRTVWYSFTPSTDLLLTADTLGSNYDTALAAYTGTSLAALSTVACNDDFFSLLSRVEFVASAGVTYHFQVGGFFGSSGNLVFNLAGEPPPTPTPTPTPCETPGKVPFDSGCGTPTPTPTPTATPTPCEGCPEMSLNVKGLGVCDDPVKPTKCTLEVGSSFTLSVEVVTAPVEGYIGVQSFIVYGSDLIYKPAAAADEIVWPDLEPAVAFSTCNTAPCTDPTGPAGQVSHGGLTGLISFTTSTFIGNYLNLSFNCSASTSQTVVELLPLGDPQTGTAGSGFLLPPTGSVQTAARVSPLTINCDAPLVVGLDTDGDGCTNVAEVQTVPGSQTTGGLRDPLNPWDFYDVGNPNGYASTTGAKDGYVDLFNDIILTIRAFSSYNVSADRGPSAGPHPWSMTAPDGNVDLFNDIIGVIRQFGHDCR